jgi:hypothetical protein
LSGLSPKIRDQNAILLSSHFKKVGGKNNIGDQLLAHVVVALALVGWNE